MVSHFYLALDENIELIDVDITVIVGVVGERGL